MSQDNTMVCTCTVTNLSFCPKNSYTVYAIACPSLIKEPQHYREAVADPGWREAMDKEI